jgi:phosphoserine phosphatase RsbU/P
MDKEFNLARDIEMGMEQNKFQIFRGRDDFECSGRLIPAKVVGGDLFDVFLLTDHQLFLYLSDSMGKGLPAANHAEMIRSFIRSNANPDARLGKMMETLNSELCLVQKPDMFATIFLGKLDLETGKLIYCNAGHPHPVILRNNNQEEVLTQSHGIPVGVKYNIHYTESRTRLAPGESMIIFTDGVTEQSNSRGEFFGTERLISILNSLQVFSTQDIVNKTLENLESFRGLTDVHDDIALVVLKFLGK